MVIPLETTDFLAPLMRRQEDSVSNVITTIYLSEPHSVSLFPKCNHIHVGVLGGSHCVVAVLWLM